MVIAEQHKHAIELMREVLGESYTHFSVSRVVIEEDIEGESTAVTCEVVDAASGDRSVIAGKGVGVIDALFQGVHTRFAKEYPSLNTIQFHSFAVSANLDTKQAFSGSDSAAEVTVEIINSENKVFSFRNASRSFTSSAIITTLEAAAYFINSERAFVTMCHALKDAKERNRSDLIQRYTNSMAQLVQNTSYSEVIAKIREDL